MKKFVEKTKSRMLTNICMVTVSFTLFFGVCIFSYAFSAGVFFAILSCSFVTGFFYAKNFISEVFSDNIVLKSKVIVGQITTPFYVDEYKAISCAELFVYLCAYQACTGKKHISWISVLVDHFKFSKAQVLKFKALNSESLQYLENCLNKQIRLKRDILIESILEYYIEKYDIQEYMDHEVVPFIFEPYEQAMFLLRVFSQENRYSFYDILETVCTGAVICDGESIEHVKKVFGVYTDNIKEQHDSVHIKAIKSEEGQEFGQLGYV